MMEAFARPLLDSALPPPPGLKTWNGSDPAPRYAVYRNGVVVKLIDALADTFPVVRQIVGEDFFHAMAREHVRLNPPDSPVLAHYGAGFPGFIAAFGPAAPLPYLAAVAGLEWARVQAFHAAEQAALPLETLRGLQASPEALGRARLIFAPPLSLIRSRHPVVSIWHAHQGEGDFSGIDPHRAEAALVTRPGLEVDVIPLGPAAASLLAGLIAGRTLGEAYESCAAGGQAPDLVALFALLLRLRALVAVDLGPGAAT